MTTTIGHSIISTKRRKDWLWILGEKEQARKQKKEKRIWEYLNH